ncbi:hypothetical protein LD972_22680 [Salmonella enterica]|nr:hypothetical protein [Salmonella enterica]MDJ4780910.1 hypothetical protein [Salmonella enterica]MDJ4885290.1 hypothetical protein [Salmonella enterica]MDJ5530690.1 hypothetical protein [Salmonella enterica]
MIGARKLRNLPAQAK